MKGHYLRLRSGPEILMLTLWNIWLFDTMKSYDFEKRNQKIQLKKGLVYVLQKQY